MMPSRIGTSPLSLCSQSTRTTRLAGRRCFTSSRPHAHYDDTVQNLKIGKHTRVMYQGFTGRVATQNATDSLAYGTNIVGGVTPGKEGEHIGLPLLPSVKEAKEALRPDATAVFVAASQCGAAIEEAIEAEIPLIVAVAEHIPLHDMLRVASILKTQSKSRLVGANAPGIIAPLGFCRIGFQPLPTFAPGHVGIVAKSGTLSYEAVASITRAGLGQSLVIGMGGDIIAGTNLVDSLRVFETDAETEVIVLIGEVGGRAEEDAADWIQDYLRREKNPKPIAALVGGRCARPQTIMGHAGAWAAPGENSAERKHSILEEAGATMVDHPEQFGGVIQTLLRQSGRDVSSKTNVQAHQRRGYHTSGRHPRPTIPHTRAVEQPPRRTLYISPEWAPVPLYPWLSKIKNLSLSFDDAPRNGYYISISIDRSARSPCLAVAPTTDPTEIHAQTQRFPYDALSAPAPQLLDSALHHLGLGAASAPTRERIAVLITSLAKMYRRKEAITLSCCISLDPASSSSSDPAIHLHQNTITLQFDDSAHRSAQRQPDIHALRQPATEDATELAAEAAGIVLVKFADPAATIGTLVNGAGLAMNTVDALRRRGGRATNFLDTGGKATRDTVKRSFELILRDRRVRVIFVNIFGGLTDGGMIAEGILLAFREVDMRNVPVVVRIRGTNEKVGQRIIAESGLGLDAFDGFEEAAKRVIELANRSSSSSSSSSSS